MAPETTQKAREGLNGYAHLSRGHWISIRHVLREQHLKGKISGTGFGRLYDAIVAHIVYVTKRSRLDPWGDNE